MRRNRKEILSGLTVENDSGHLYLEDDFQKLNLNFELAFIRHGKTYGNCGQVTHDSKVDSLMVETNKKSEHKAVFQGNVDLPINALNKSGRQQANKTAIILKQELLNKGWFPDIILHSPLSRALETALPFIEQNNFERLLRPCNEIREISFGAWENLRRCDLPDNHTSHLFYRDQNALVKSAINESLLHQPESFCDVILRAYHFLSELNSVAAQKKIIMFSHSVFGSACAILLGKSQNAETHSYLAFDGKRESDGSSYTLPHATPIKFNCQV